MLLGLPISQVHFPCAIARAMLVALTLTGTPSASEDGPLLPRVQQDSEEFPNPSTVMKPVGPPPDPVVVLGRPSSLAELMSDPTALPIGQSLPADVFLTDDEPSVSPGPTVIEPVQPTLPSRGFDEFPAIEGLSEPLDPGMIGVPLVIPSEVGQPAGTEYESDIDLVDLEQEEPDEYDERTLPRFRPVRPGKGVTRFNIGIALSETLLNEIAADVRDQASRVCDRILGANVTGVSNTRSMTRVDCRPNADTAQIDMVLQSLTNSSTIGIRPDATVATQGRHRADLVKSVFFDGFKLTTRKPRGVVRANNQNNSVMTPFSRLPLVGPLATNIARQQAERSRPVAESIAAERLTAQVVPEFNNAVDAQLSELNTSLKTQLQPMLSKSGLTPQQLKTSTVDTELRIRARFGQDRAVETSTRRSTGRLASLLLHESAVNSVIDSIGLAGREVSDRQLRQLLDRFRESTEDLETDAAPGAGGFALEVASTEPELYSLVFAKQQPISVRFDDGTTRVVLRVSIKAASGQQLPLQEITIPMDLLSGQASMRLNFGEPKVVPADGTAPGDLQRVIAEEVGKQLKAVDFPRSQSLPVGDRSLRVTLGQTTTENGWLLIAID